jgi:hypothetical protein
MNVQLPQRGAWLHRTTAYEAAQGGDTASTRGGCCHAVPLNSAESSVSKKPPERIKTTIQLLEGWPFATHVSVSPEPTAGRKSPAPLAFFAWDRVAIP